MEWLLRELMEFYERKSHHTSKEELYIWLYYRAKRRGDAPPKIETILRYLRQAAALGLIALTPNGKIYIFPARIAAYLNGRKQATLFH